MISLASLIALLVGSKILKRRKEASAALQSDNVELEKQKLPKVSEASIVSTLMKDCVQN